MKKLFAFMFFAFVITSCELFESDQKEKGCTDSKALNHDYSADENDGTCIYSNVTFYAAYGYYTGIPITNIDVSINGVNIGTITSVYPSGPGNCSAVGTVNFQFSDGNSVDWNTTVHLANGGIVYGSGSIEPNNFTECIKVNVTR